MKLGVRGKLFLVSLALIALSAVAADVVFSTALDRLLTAHIRDDLLARARILAAAAAARPPALDDIPGWDRLADELGGVAGTRVTVVRRDGTVLGDSEVPADIVPALPGHGDRPEIAAALRTGQGENTRQSVTVGRRMLYVAVPLHLAPGAGGAARSASAPSGAVGAVRVALPLHEVDRVLRRVEVLLGVASLLGLLVAALLSSFAAHLLSRSLRQLTAAARRMAEGDLQVRCHLAGQDELTALGGALNQLAEGLSGTLGELEAERDLQRGILRGMREGVLLLDRQGRILLVNPALREMLLLSGETKGRLVSEVLGNAELHAALSEARLRGVASAEIDVAGLAPRRLLLHAAALADEPARLLAVFVDVTDLRRLESLRRDFVANASHELRTPVAALRSAAETLRGAALHDPEAASRFLDIIERNAERLMRLIEDLLDLSRIESRAVALRREPLPLRRVAEHVLGLLRGRAEARRQHLGLEIPTDLPEVMVDRRALEQVLVNLIDNAIKYCPEGARIRVGGAADPGCDEVTLWVSDTGPGIEPRHLPRLFERFYRVDAGRSRELGGTGLGLAIVRHLCEAMGGTVEVQSQVGAGSRFTVRLPAAPTA